MIENIFLTGFAILFSLVLIYALLLFGELPYKSSKRLLEACAFGIFIAGIVKSPMDWLLILSGFYFLIINVIIEALRN